MSHNKAHPLAVDQISFSNFCRGSPSDHCCQIVFNSDNWFQRRCLKFPTHSHIRETGHTLWRPCFLMDQICLCYFYRRSSSDHFYQIILNSDHQFQERVFSFCYHDKPRPLVVYVSYFKFPLAMFVEGYLRNIPVKFG